MSFFKHFTDAHRGRSLQNILDQAGHVGASCYWILVELCTEKLTEKIREKSFSKVTKEDCVFRFHPRSLFSPMRVKSPHLERLLGLYQSEDLLTANNLEGEIEIAMPKLLEYLHRDSKRARAKRAGSAAIVDKRKSSEKEKEKEEESVRETECVLAHEPSAEDVAFFSKSNREIILKRVKGGEKWSTIIADLQKTHNAAEKVGHKEPGTTGNFDEPPKLQSLKNQSNQEEPNAG